MERGELKRILSASLFNSINSSVCDYPLFRLFIYLKLIFVTFQ